LRRKIALFWDDTFKKPIYAPKPFTNDKLTIYDEYSIDFIAFLTSKRSKDITPCRNHFLARSNHISPSSKRIAAHKKQVDLKIS
jgi:hypothetical protein